MSVGRIDGPHVLQSAAEAQRVRQQADEAARGQDQAQRFAAALREARRRQQVTAPGAGGEAGRAEPWRAGRGQRERGGADHGAPRERRRQGAADRAAGAGAAGSSAGDGAPAPVAPQDSTPVPEDVPAKGRRLDLRG